MTEYLGSGSLNGASTLSTPPVYLTIAFSGTIAGTSTLSDGIVHNDTGSVSGTSTLASPNVYLTRNDFGSISGSSTLQDSSALPIYGLSVFTSYYEVTSTPIPLSCKCTPTKSFRWMHQFVRGDLGVFINGELGPISPFEVTFSLFYQLGEEWFQVGPVNRQPLSVGVGEYYIIGTAGEFGQPGSWQVQWSYRKSFNDFPVVTTQSFQIVDAVSSPIPGDLICRHRKYGWD